MFEQKEKYTSNKINILKKENEELRRIIRMKEETISYYEKSVNFGNMIKVIQGGTSIQKKQYSPISEENSIYNSHTPIKEFSLIEENSK